jgi:hypothetical protein
MTSRFDTWIEDCKWCFAIKGVEWGNDTRQQLIEFHNYNHETPDGLRKFYRTPQEVMILWEKKYGTN